ncbi:MAG: sporulation protein [Firmicutes bacterium]|nr:sporulation protein [Candidatus Fermentithermobacillaceae bacterium]
MDLQEMLGQVASKLEQFLSTKTVVGEPIVIGNVSIVPLQAASFGFGSGGGEGKTPNNTGTGGGAGAGASLHPVALVVVKGDDVKVYGLGRKGILEAITDLIPEAICKAKQAIKARENPPAEEKKAE